MSVPQSNSTHTIEMPMPDEERTRRTPVEPLTADSIGNVTRVATSCGARPWASVTTVTVGAVRSGNTSMGASRALTVPYTRTPTATMMTSSRLAIDQWMRRSMGGSVRVAVSGDRAGGRRELDLVGAAGDDALAGGQALEHLGPAVRPDPEPQRPALERLALDHHVRDLAPPVLDDREIRDRQRLTGRTGRDHGPREVADPQLPGAVVHLEDHGDGSRLRIDDAADRDERAVRGIDGERRVVAIDREPRGPRALDARHVGLEPLGHEPHPVEVDHAEQP